MTTKIVIDDVEYEIACGPEYYTGRDKTVRLRPKRKQTGWICRACGDDAPCVSIDGPIGGAIRHCPLSKTEPFYGMVE